jgi:hypothetical protein
MKVEIIYTEHYALIVSDEKIVEGSFIYETNIGEVSKVDKWYCEILEKGVKVEPSVKVIAHRPLSDAPILEGVPLLPEFGKEDDVKRISLEMGKEFYIGGNYDFENGVRKGYNKAKETYKYTEEDLRKALLIKHDGLSVDYVIQSLQTKRSKSILLETVGDTETINRCENFDIEIGCVASKCTCENLSIPKTITNSQGQTELIGTYYYE